MKEITKEETQTVTGGIAFLAPVAVAMLADVSFWSALGTAGTLGTKYGSWLSNNSQTPGASKNDLAFNWM